ncbi:MAG: gamma-aminobutyraldehyde dehydrogenase, partial [Actinomadura rubrobrunea]|nr:gamma-aminobutyraldehyde dehydrogenase [Actinomadura rubrobrunea]
MKGSIVTIDGWSGLRNVVGADADDDLIDPGTGPACAAAPEPGAAPGERAPVPLRIPDAVEGHAPVGVQSRAAGRPVRMTLDEEVPPMVDDLRVFAGAGRLPEGRAAGDRTEHRTSSVRWEPTGGCTQDTPWISPMTTAGGAVTRPSQIAEFLSAGVFTVVCGDRDTGRAMADHPIPQAVPNTE